MHTYEKKRIPTPQVVWDHGYERYNSDGTTTIVSELRPLRARSLPRNMICKLTTVYAADGSVRSMQLVRQARSKYARMVDSYFPNGLSDATECVIKWAGRILRERYDEVEWTVTQ